MDFKTLIIFIGVFACLVFLASFIFSYNNSNGIATGGFLMNPMSFSMAFMLSLAIIGAVFIRSIPRE